MTVIAAARNQETTWIASDSMANNNGTKIYGVEKWIARGSWAIGHAGNRRTFNVIKANADDLLDGVTGPFDLTCRIRDALDGDGFNTDAEEGPKSYGQQMIVAHPGGLWTVCTGFSLIEIPEGEVWADGSGRSYALGAGYATAGNGEERVKAAIEAAIRFSDGCGGEVWVDQIR